jgi:hypothetical protein
MSYFTEMSNQTLKRNLMGTSSAQVRTALVSSLDSLAEAETYCEAKVEQISNLRCDIYDHTGKSKPSMLTYVNRAYLKSPQKHAYLGWVLLASGLLCFWIQWHGSGTIIPVVVGIT